MNAIEETIGIAKFEAPTLAEAIEKVRERWGNHAVILHVEKCSEKKNRFGKPREWVEITARGSEQKQREMVAPKAHDYRPVMEELVALRGEIQEYQSTVQQLERIQWAQSQLNGKALKHPLLDYMIERGLSSDYAMECLIQWLSKGEALKISDCLHELDRALPRLTLDEIFPIHEGRTTFLIGLPGAGKTTLLLKIAAQLTMAQRREVVIVAADMSKSGGIQEVSLYSEILQVPVITIFNLYELKDVIQKLSSKVHVLVDWNGFSMTDANCFEILKSLSVHDLRLQYLLTISMASDPLLWRGARDRLAPLPMVGLALTQGDLDGRIGKVWEAVRNTNLPVALFSLGKNIPGEFFEGKGFHFAEKLFGKYKTTIPTTWV